MQGLRCLLIPHQHSLSFFFFFWQWASCQMWDAISLGFWFTFSLVINNGEQVFIYLLAICVFSLEKCLFKSVAILKWGYLGLFVCFCIVECRSYLHILDINSLSDIWVANIFSLSIGHLCTLDHLLCRSFIVECSLTCLFLLSGLLVSCTWNHCKDQCPGAFSLYFLLGGLKKILYLNI